jgi:prepilin-type N-terminal cleavage/methylation domain-containing protein
MSGTMRGKDVRGFTLIEILVAMVIAAIVMTSVYSVYYSQQRSYIIQEEVAAMHQNLRAAMSIMEREIRMAGCNPTGNASNVGFLDNQANRIQFTEDVRGKDPGDPPDGDTGDTDEDISYYLTDADGDGEVDRGDGGRHRKSHRGEHRFHLFFLFGCERQSYRGTGQYPICQDSRDRYQQ